MSFVNGTVIVSIDPLSFSNSIIFWGHLNVVWIVLSSWDKYPTKYGRQLFKYFCDKKQSVHIQDYLQISAEVKRVLLTDEFSSEPIIKLFPNLVEIMFTEIEINAMTNNANH